MSTTSSTSSQRCNGSDKRRLCGLAFIAIMANATYTTIAPILPLEMDKHNIPEVYVSIIFLAFTFGSLLAPALFAKYFESYGRMNIIASSMVGMSILFWCLGQVFDVANAMCARNINHQYDVVVASLMFIIQLLLGAFYAMITTGYYSLASLAFVQKESAMSVVESSVGIGHIVGPIIGSILYDEQGYRCVYTMGVPSCMLLSAFASWTCFVPLFENKTAVEDAPCRDCSVLVDSTEKRKSLDDENSLDDVESTIVSSRSIGSSEREMITGYQSMNIQLMQKHEIQKLSAMSLLRFPNIFFAALSICWVMVAWAFLEPLLAKQLDNKFHVGSKGIGIIFSLTSIIYVPATLLVQWIPSFIGRHTAISVSLIITPFAVLLIGSNSLDFVVLGVGLLGLLPAPVWVLLLPWMQEESLEMFPNPETKLYANDLTASIYNSFMTFGKVLGYGIGTLFGSTGFVTTTQMVAILVSLHSIVFYLCTKESKREILSRG